MCARSSAFSTDDTIVAIATPPGRGAIGIVRLSGTDALSIVSTMLDREVALEPRRATFARVKGQDAWPGDEVVATYFQAPRSYTGEETVEISAHGSPVVLRSILDSALRAGARLARPGEFTLRAFLNGKRDLIQAEAVADLIDAVTPAQARVAFDQLQGTLTARIAVFDQQLFELIARLEASLDFPDEGYHFVDGAGSVRELANIITDLEALLRQGRRGRMIREGIQVVITGRPNTGKSFIFNRLLGSERAIVASVAGTTRDLLSERVDIEGIPMLLVDTAGLRDSGDEIEAEGVRRASGARSVADVVLLVVDGSVPLEKEDVSLLEAHEKHRLIVANKSDLPIAFDVLPNDATFLRASAKENQGIDEIRRSLATIVTGYESRQDSAVISNVRHMTLMEEALEHMRSAHRALLQQTPEEFVLSDLASARARFDEIVGTRTTEDVLAHIFARFCIGK